MPVELVPTRRRSSPGVTPSSETLTLVAALLAILLLWCLSGTRVDNAIAPPVQLTGP